MGHNYLDLEIFHLGYQFVLDLYPHIDKFPESEHRNLVIQMKRSAVSIPLNIVEGSSRKTNREFLTFLGYAYGSGKEMEVSLNLAKDLGFLKDEDHVLLCEKLQKFLAKLVLFTRYLETKVPPRKEVVMTAISRGDSPWEQRTSK